MSIRVLYRYIVYLFIIIIPVVCGIFGGITGGIISDVGNWDFLINGFIGLFNTGNWGRLINGIIGLCVGTIVCRFILTFFIHGSSKENTLWEYYAWILSYIVGSVICWIIVKHFRIILGINIGLIIGIIVDAIIFGFIVTILNIDSNLESIANNLQILTTRYTSSNEDTNSNERS
ncbi:MAG: hypothetical protein LBB89_08170 [Treponema sp.]|jgi:hypothetical protein|nr:hypothetical protein [Treponema sp.]